MIAADAGGASQPIMHSCAESSSLAGAGNCTAAAPNPAMAPTDAYWPHSRMWDMGSTSRDEACKSSQADTTT